MEIKKSSRADLENRRTEGFLLGLVFTLALLFVGFEYTLTDDDDDIDMEGLEAFLDNAELMPLAEQKDMMALPETEKPPVAERLKVVDEEVEPAEPEEQHQAELLEAEPDEEEALPDVTDMDNHTLDREVAEVLPQFPGGAIALMKWLTQNLKYPQSAQQRRVQGKVVAQFIVGKDGTVSDIRIVESLDQSCDREALRVLRMMPRWKAGTQADKPCRSMVCIPIVFKL